MLRASMLGESPCTLLYYNLISVCLVYVILDAVRVIIVLKADFRWTVHACVNVYYCTCAHVLKIRLRQARWFFFIIFFYLAISIKLLWLNSYNN